MRDDDLMAAIEATDTDDTAGVHFEKALTLEEYTARKLAGKELLTAREAERVAAYVLDMGAQGKAWAKRFVARPDVVKRALCAVEFRRAMREVWLEAGVHEPGDIVTEMDERQANDDAPMNPGFLDCEALVKNMARRMK